MKDSVVVTNTVAAFGPAVRTAGRFAELDGLRGVAALLVVLHHAIVALPPASAPVQAFWRFGGLLVAPILLLSRNADGAVMVFFGLSGFVLALQAMSGRVPTYATFLVRRLFRIYLPYLAAVVFSIALVLVASGRLPPGLENWKIYGWDRALDADTVVNYLLMTGADNWVDSPMWTFAYEMRVSLVFPLMFLPARRLGAAGFLVTAAVLAATWVGIHAAGLSDALVDNLALTPVIALVVLGGAVLAFQLDALRATLGRLPPAIGVGLLVAGLLTATVVKTGHKTPTELLAGLGSLAVLAACLAEGPVARLLRRPTALWLGKISFSLYLLHWPVLVATIRLTHGLLPGAAATLLGLVLSFAVAIAGERFVERTATAAGRRLTRRPGVPLDARAPSAEPRRGEVDDGAVEAGA